MKIIDVKNTKKNIVFSIKSTEKEFDNMENKGILSLASNLKIDGFRKGKIPFNEAKKRIDQSLLLEKIVNFFIKDSIGFITKSNEFKKYDNDIIEAPPSADVKKISLEDKEIEIDFSFDLFPKISIDGYKNIKLNSKLRTITSADIDEEINKELSKNALSIPKNDGMISKGDIVVFDFKGFLNDKPFEGGEAQNYELKIGSNSFIPGFEEQMIGLKNNDQKSINVKFPGDYHQKELANKNVRFDLKINSVSYLENETLDNDFVKSLNIEGIFTVDEYKKYIKNSLVKKAESKFNEEKEKEYFEKLLVLAKLDFIPDSLIKINTDKSIDNLKLQLKNYGIPDYQMYFKMIGMTEEQFYEKQKEASKNQLIISMALDKIAEIEKCKVSKEELEAKLNELAIRENLTVSEIKNKLQDNIFIVEQQALQEKIIKKLIGN